MTLPRARRTPPRRPALHCEALEDRTVPAIVGVVFKDHDNDAFRDTADTQNDPFGTHGWLRLASGLGTAAPPIDPGVAGVLVSAYADGNALAAQATTGADGSYRLETPPGRYRVEFALPAGFLYGVTPEAGNPGVRFLDDGANADLAVVRPAESSAADNRIAAARFAFGPNLGATAHGGQPTVVEVRNHYGTIDYNGTPEDYDAITARTLALAQQTGAVFGVAWQPNRETVYVSSFFKRHAGFGPGANGQPTPGAIYRVDSSAGAVPNATLYVDLDQLFPGSAGPNRHAAALTDAAFDTDNGDAAWDAVGKTGLGDLDISSDGRTLYAMNLGDRMLYAVPLDKPPTAENIRRVALPTLLPNSTGVAGDARPFAVEYHRGKVYVGIVNTAESTITAATPDGDPSKLRAYVYEVDPGSMTVGAAPVLEVPLDGPRGSVYVGLAGADRWHPWSPSYRNLATGPRVVYPQPWLTGLAFDADGNLSLAFRDRLGDQTGLMTLSNPADNIRREGIAGGDLLRAFVGIPGDLNSGWTLEHNARGPAGQGSSPRNNLQGPGGGEFHSNDSANAFQQEIAAGSVLILPGSQQVAATANNPVKEVPEFQDGGLAWFNLERGEAVRKYRLFDGAAATAGQPTFGATNGVGSLDAQVSQPVSIASRVWRDDNANGLQDPGEPGLAGVAAELSDAAGTILATVWTDADGNALFSSSPTPAGIPQGAVYEVAGLFPNTDGYVVKLADRAQYFTGGPLDGGLATPFREAPGGSDGIIANGYFIADVTTGPVGVFDKADFGIVPRQTDGANDLAISKRLLLSSTILGQYVPPPATPEGNAAYVAQLYQTLLGRAADAVGLHSYAAQLDRGIARATVVQSILRSPEYAARAVRTVYLDCLGRAPDASAAGYVERLARGEAAAAVFGEILGSDEFRARFADDAAWFAAVNRKAGGDAGAALDHAALARRGQIALARQALDSAWGSRGLAELLEGEGLLARIAAG